ncbi:MAG: phenylalanine--tRNA ligase subunit beta [Acidimicrobiales bacterium]
MEVLLSWLNELAPVGVDVAALADTMNDLGLAVDGIETVGAPIDGVVVAKVLGLRPHPDADRMQLVDVDTGDGQSLQICCGAFNMAVGDLVPLATVGTVMPDGRAINRAKKRGEWSNGMLCSPAELGLSSDAEGIAVLPSGLDVGAPVFGALGVSPDVVFDLDLTRNRPDAYAHLGIARDLAARLHVPFAPSLGTTVDVDGKSEGITVTLDKRSACGRFTAHLVTGVFVTESPRWLAERLSRAGMRPINNIVDVSNYVMLEMGRPNHTYDMTKLEGGGFRVRSAHSAETVETLDGVTRVLTTDDVAICDGNDVVIGIGGIMGGASTEIDANTSAVALEMAWFEPSAIASSGARLGLRSEASMRFERGCDTDDMAVGARRFIELLRLTCPDARLHEMVDAVGSLPPRPAIAVRTSRVNALLGTELDSATIKDLLDPIGFATKIGTDGVLQVQLPTWRYDATAEVDVIEEVARHHGYGRIAKTVPKSTVFGGLTPLQRDRRLVRQVLVGLGITEAMPNAFLAPGDLERSGLPGTAITITNPLDADESVLRTSLLPGLLKAIAYNASHRRLGARFFEIGHIYGVPDEPATLPDEREIIAIALAGTPAIGAVAVLDELVAVLAIDGLRLTPTARPGLHPSRTAVVTVNSAEVGVVGEVDPDVAAAYSITERVAWLALDLPALLAHPHGPRAYRKISRFPSSDIDLAFVVDDSVAAFDIESTMREAAGDLLVDLQLFDVFRGPSVPQGSRSLAYALRLQSNERTLTDGEVAAVRKQIVDAVTRRHGARLRG